MQPDIPLRSEDHDLGVMYYGVEPTSSALLYPNNRPKGTTLDPLLVFTIAVFILLVAVALLLSFVWTV
jgi:hypothetical protein